MGFPRRTSVSDTGCFTIFHHSFLQAETWTLVSISGNAPSARFSHSAVLEDPLDLAPRMWVFGGSDSFSSLVMGWEMIRMKTTSLSNFGLHLLEKDRFFFAMIFGPSMCFVWDMHCCVFL